MPVLDLKAGDLVEVKTAGEILATLDSRGCLDGMPFMPEMLAFCGRRFRVRKRAHKTCDTATRTGGRGLPATVHLDDLRCDGAAHGGCEAGCLLFWKEAWLRRVEGETSARAVPPAEISPDSPVRRAVAGPPGPGGELRYRCQATELPSYTRRLAWWDVRQYVEDLRSGNVTGGQLVRGFSFAAFRRLVELGVGYRFLVGLYDRLAARRGSGPWPIRSGTLDRTPTQELGLQPGEWVRVKSQAEILATVDRQNRNRGMTFDPEMARFCGGTYRVQRRVTRILEESSGRVLEFRNPCIVLEQVYCHATLSKYRLFCPRAIPSYWREIWLERVPGPPVTVQGARP